MDWNFNGPVVIVIAVIVVAMGIVLNVVAGNTAQAYKDGDRPQAIVTLAVDKQIRDVSFVGATNKYFFFYSTERETLEIIRKDQVTRNQSVADQEDQPTESIAEEQEDLGAETPVSEEGP